MNDDILKRGQVAVVTGAAKGIGAAAARAFVALGMTVCLFDRDKEALTALCGTLGPLSKAIAGDVTSARDLKRLRDAAYSVKGEVALLLNNAGAMARSGPWDSADDWRRLLEINLISMVTAHSLFVPRMMAQGSRSAIVNLGSKEGITTPPGKAAYSVSKAGVKVLTEQLAHELRNAVGDKITAHLLVPGYTWTPMNGMRETTDAKPAEAWSADQTVGHFLDRFRRGDFYIICPDNAVTADLDAKRIQWASNDIIYNRPALSRWHPEWSTAFNDKVGRKS